jgi:hypothetical protein
LSNVITSILFTRECLKFKIIEHLFDLQENATTMGVVALIMNCFNALDINSNQKQALVYFLFSYDFRELIKLDGINRQGPESYRLGIWDNAHKIGAKHMVQDLGLYRSL